MRRRIAASGVRPRPAPTLARFAALRPGEGRAVVAAFAYYFCLLSGYYVLRPLRDEMGIAASHRVTSSPSASRRRESLRRERAVGSIEAKNPARNGHVVFNRS